MRARLVLPVALVVALAGCGGSSVAERPRAAGHDPARPTWGGCRTHAVQSIDYAPGARGAGSRSAALAPYLRPGDHVVHQPRQPHRNAAWLLVDEHQVIHTSVELMRGDRGWLVGAVDRCSD